MPFRPLCLLTLELSDKKVNQILGHSYIANSLAFQRWASLSHCPLIFSRGGPPFQADYFQRWAPLLYRKLTIFRGEPPFYTGSWCFQEVGPLFKLNISRGAPPPPFYIGSWYFQEVGHPFHLIISRGGPFFYWKLTISKGGLSFFMGNWCFERWVPLSCWWFPITLIFVWLFYHFAS